MYIEIEFKTDNAAFEGENYFPEVSGILMGIVQKIVEEDKWEGKIVDINGNTIGDYTAHDDRKEE